MAVDALHWETSFGAARPQGQYAAISFWLRLRLSGPNPSLPAGINVKGATPPGGLRVRTHDMCNGSGCWTRRPPKKGGGAPLLSPFSRLTPCRASIRRNHRGGYQIENLGLCNGTKKVCAMGCNSISHALRSPALCNGVPNSGQFPLQESASNPLLARAAISRNSQILEGLIRGQRSALKNAKTGPRHLCIAFDITPRVFRFGAAGSDLV